MGRQIPRVLNRGQVEVRSRLPRGDVRLRPWRSAVPASEMNSSARCNICGWHGTRFTTPFHSEGGNCPHCNSIGRDRFLFWCWTKRTPYQREARVLETSPRLGQEYRDVMGSRVAYTCSDYDESAHRGMIKLDLQDAAVPDSSFDVILTPHVLEHVPNTDKALSEIHRILAPGGVMFLQIPMPRGETAPPSEPEFHGDNTPVFWHFGWDLRDKLTAAGFDVRCLVTADLKHRIANKMFDSGYNGADVNEVDLLSHGNASSLVPIATSEEAQLYGFLPDLHYVTWEAKKR